MLHIALSLVDMHDESDLRKGMRQRSDRESRANYETCAPNF
jgi:hypothetical protein